MILLGLDPGNVETGWALFDTAGKVLDSGVSDNLDVLGWVRAGQSADILAIEMMRARGMPTSNEEFRTLVWIGRYQQAWRDPEAVQLVYRADAKMHVCGNMQAKDSNIRAALIDMLGPQGTKRQPGPTYGVKSHAWAALAVCVTAAAAQHGKPPGLLQIPALRAV